MEDNPDFRRRCFLRGTSNKIDLSDGSRHQLNLPHVLIEKMGWKVNDKLKVDVIKNGLEFTLQIIKE